MTKKHEDEIVISTDVSTTGPTNVSIIAETGTLSISGETVTVVESEGIPVKGTSTPSKDVSDKTATEAIYNYLRYLRSRDRTMVSMKEIANALSLSISQVERIVATLRSRGVKVEQ